MGSWVYFLSLFFLDYSLISAGSTYQSHSPICDFLHRTVAPNSSIFSFGSFGPSLVCDLYSDGDFR